MSLVSHRKENFIKLFIKFLSCRKENKGEKSGRSGWGRAWVIGCHHVDPVLGAKRAQRNSLEWTVVLCVRSVLSGKIKGWVFLWTIRFK